MTPKLIGAAVLCAVSLTTAPVAATQIEDSNAEARINLSGKLRMLSQRIPSAACHLATGVDTAGASALLQSASTEFEDILSALENGDAALQINGAEKRRKTIAKIHELRAAWEPMKAAANQLSLGDVSQENVGAVLNQNMTVLASANLLSAEIVAQYSDPTTILQSDSMLIDIAGRQRMLTQKMSKESCMLGSGYATAETKSDLETTMQTFEASLEALSNGMQAAGIAPPPTPEIRQGLQTVKAEYSVAKPTLSAVLAGETVASDAAEAKFQSLNATMNKMNDVVTMYSNATRL